MGDKEAAQAATLTTAYRVLREAAVLCSTPDCEHGLDRRHGLLLGVNSVPGFLVQELQLGTNQAKVANNQLGKLGLRSSTSEGNGKFLHVVSLGPRTTITAEMVASLNGQATTVPAASIEQPLGAVALKAADAKSTDIVQQFLGDVDALRDQRDALLEELAILRSEVVVLRADAENGRRLREYLEADRG